ncbi:MAG: 30S ribosomal protein S16 [Candidatus Omnitrophota bacterium]|nr:MAG: 30S ribosomal protein S16 [Candidatus Omnitrophota bacterium]
MLRIRLKKVGKSVKRRYHFRISVMDSTKARDAKSVEEIGYYNPSQKLLKIDIDKYQYWVQKGAKPSDTVRSLAKRYKKAQ